MAKNNSTPGRSRGLRVGVAALAVPALFLTACSPSGEAPETTEGGEGRALSIATGGTGGVYYPLGGGIANVITQNVEGYEATAQETNASVDNMLLIQSGAADLALAVGDTVAAAEEGTGPFEGNPIDICAIGSMYNNYMQLVTTEGTGIESAEDLRGKTVSVGAPGSATEVGAVRTLEAAGLDPETDIDRRQLGAAETVAALRDGTIAAGFWSGGLPTGALVDLASTGDMKLVPIGDYADELASEYGDYYVQKEVPANTYEGQAEAISTIASPNIMVAGSSMDEQLQQDLTRAIFENKENLVQVHPAAEELDASTAGEIPFVDTCPGSQAYYDQAAG